MVIWQPSKSKCTIQECAWLSLVFQLDRPQSPHHHGPLHPQQPHHPLYRHPKGPARCKRDRAVSASATPDQFDKPSSPPPALPQPALSRLQLPPKPSPTPPAAIVGPHLPRQAGPAGPWPPTSSFSAGQPLPPPPFTLASPQPPPPAAPVAPLIYSQIKLQRLSILLCYNQPIFLRSSLVTYLVTCLAR